MSSLRGAMPWLPMAALGVLLSGALVFLYSKTQSHDSADYFSNVALLQQIKQLDVRWELDAMKSRIGLNQSYDPLVDPLQPLSLLQQQLNTLASVPRQRDNPMLARHLATFQQALDEKTGLIELFKSHNAVLRNSLAFLPSAAQEIGHEESGNADLSTVRQVVNQALLATLVYQQGGADEMVPEIEAELAQLALAKPAQRTDMARRIDIFIAHTHTVLREHGVVNALLAKISAAPTTRTIDHFNGDLHQAQLHDLQMGQRYRLYLLVFAAALIALFLYAVVRLIRSHAIIQRVNGQLQHANDHLERRVQQRTEELQETQSQLIAAARQAGMAEIATNVLHNVGNVLNSVSVSAGLVANQLRKSKIVGLGKAVSLMKQHADHLGEFLTQDDKGKCLPAYLDSLASAVWAEQAGVIDELAGLLKSVDHIKDIVARQQSYAGASCVFEQGKVSDLMDEAVTMSAVSLASHRITVVKEYASVPLMVLDRHRVLQILVNLLSNAKRAMEGVPDRAHQITIRLGSTLDNTLQIQVIDNGEGIVPDNLSRIFAHGFTTRKAGHGFGLHSCVLASQEMGGSLTAHSDGWGQGAMFVLTLPMGPAGRAVVPPGPTSVRVPVHLQEGNP